MLCPAEHASGPAQGYVDAYRDDVARTVLMCLVFFTNGCSAGSFNEHTEQLMAVTELLERGSALSAVTNRPSPPKVDCSSSRRESQAANPLLVEKAGFVSLRQQHLAGPAPATLILDASKPLRNNGHG